jgi:hypothetical protein
MSDVPISRGEFNNAMASLRDILSRLEKNQEVLSNDIKQLYELHRNCMFAQSEKAFHAGRAAGKIEEVNMRVTDLETDQRDNRGHKRQLSIGIILTALAAMASLVTSLFLKK